MPVDTSRISFGEMVAGASALALLIFMFLPWYGVSTDVPGFEASVNANAWESLSLIDILLFLVILVTLALVVARATGNMPTELPASPGLIIAVAGAVALVLILIRIISIPGPDVDVEGVEFGRKIGVFLSLLAAGGITFGGYTAMNERPAGRTAAPAAGPPPGGPGPGGPGPGGPGAGPGGPGPAA
jgi:hypothetical protein